MENNKEMVMEFIFNMVMSTPSHAGLANNILGQAQLAKEVGMFVDDPGDFISNSEKSINAQQIILAAKMLCEACHFMDENICPFIRDLP